MKAYTLFLVSCLLLVSCRERLIKEQDFGRLGFSASGCNGSCPIIQIEIDSNKNYYFHGIRYVDKIGFYKGQMPDSLYKAFISNIEKIRNYELKPNETLLKPIADNPTYEYKILSKSGAEIKYDNLQDDKLLREFLLNSYKQLHLSEVDTLAFLTSEKI